jgi:RimJ/RimL family protein N-acetyltransferase
MLRKYNHTEFNILAGWITSAELLFRFSGPDWSFPLSPDVLQVYMDKHPERQFYWGVSSDGLPYAFGEIIRGDANSPRLGRLLLNETQRGKGLGQVFVSELLQECIRIDRPEQVFLFVFEDNRPAVACYLKCGFKFCDETYIRVNHEGMEARIRKMAFNVINDY